MAAEERERSSSPYKRPADGEASLVEDTDSLVEPNGDLKVMDKQLKVGALNRHSSMKVAPSEGVSLLQPRRASNNNQLSPPAAKKGTSNEADEQLIEAIEDSAEDGLRGDSSKNLTGVYSNQKIKSSSGTAALILGNSLQQSPVKRENKAGKEVVSANEKAFARQLQQQ